AALASIAAVPEPFTTVKPVLAEGFPRAVTGEHVCPMIEPLLRRRHCPFAIAPIGNRVGPVVVLMASVLSAWRFATTSVEVTANGGVPVATVEMNWLSVRSEPPTTSTNLPDPGTI